MAGKIENVELGFVEEAETNELISKYFPSKIGGKPSWLSLSPLPVTSDVTCEDCGNILVFLLQVYAPGDSGKDFTFHRTLFIFICRNPTCCLRNSNKNLVVLRSQLPRYNSFYSPDPPNSSDCIASDITPEKYQTTCCVCGISGPKKCAKCKQKFYCCKEHQIIDWKSGHKKTCEKSEFLDDYTSTLLFPEFELVTEAEHFTENPPEKTEVEKMKELNQFLKSEKAESLLEGVAPEDIEKMANKEEDEAFMKFKKRIEYEPEQVLRYNKGKEPLWVSRENIPTSADIPNCNCGAVRQFEFQVMPQLLNHLKVDLVGDSIDWGTLCIYTCKDSCDIGNKYVKEFIWKQDYLLGKQS